MLPNGFKKRFKRVIQFELNELSKPNIDYLIAKGLCPNFQKINQSWQVIETTSETDYQYLEPWIQWITVHTGKTFQAHQIFHLSDADQLKFPQIWEVLSDAGLESCIIGSMNARQGRAKGGVFFPDPWSKAVEAYPEALNPLYRLIQNKVQSHASARRPLSLADLCFAVKTCFDMRIPGALILRIVYQIFSQKYDDKNRWRLAVLFDKFLFAICARLLKTTNYSFYTLFLNAIAHYQHHYWRHFQKELFDPTIAYQDCHITDDPVTTGYLIYDKLLGEVLKLSADPNTLVIMATGLSQVPYLKDEAQGGMNYYRLRDHDAFLKKLHLPGKAIPLMSRDWQILFDNLDQDKIDSVKKHLLQLHILDQPLFSVSQNSPHSLFVETAITKKVSQEAMIIDPVLQTSFAFEAYFTNTAIKSGHHDTRGTLWLSQPNTNFENQLSVPLKELFYLPQQALLGEA